MLRMESDASPMVPQAVNRSLQYRAFHLIYKDIQLMMQAFHDHRLALPMVFRCAPIPNPQELSENACHSNRPILRYLNTIGAIRRKSQ